MKVVRIIPVCLGLMMVSTTFQNCTPAQFTMIDPEAKNAKVAGQNVFGGGEGEIDVLGEPNNGEVPAFDRNGDGVIDERDIDLAGGVDGDGRRTENPIDGNSNGNTPNGDMQVSYMCSDERSDNDGNIAGMTMVRVEVIAANGGVVCAFNDSSVRSQIMSQKKFSLTRLSANCSHVGSGRYSLRLRNPARTGTNVVVSGENVDRVSSGWKRVGGKLRLVMDRNPEQSQQISNVNCDTKASPLVIHMHADVDKAEPLQLTSQGQGVWFDILGGNADPVAHAAKRISWHRSKQYYYIALPNSRGEVRGIDQLFGDNTLGPDGRFAADGYAALAKYDGKTADGRRQLSKSDGYITDADAIFSKLRLWRDLNFDGVAQKHELQSLSQAGIAIIDLNFDAHYKEVDAHGNETLYKSVVQDTSGRLHLLFDVWFNPGAPKTTAPLSRGLASVR